MTSPADWSPKRCVVIGASGGIGQAFVQHLTNRAGVEHVYCASRKPMPSANSDGQSWLALDYAKPETISAAAEDIGHSGPVDLVIVATGLLHDDGGFGPEKTLRSLDADALSRSYLINAIGPALVAKAFLPLMVKDKKSVFAALSARVGSISDNRVGGWYGYRAAKAALNQMLKTAAIEHGRRWKESVVVGLHPGTVDTGLSKPFQRNVAEGKLFTAAYSAQSMLDVLDGLQAADSGKVFAYDGTEVPA